MIKYNKNTSPIVLREYGRNLQRLAMRLVDIKDKEERKRYSYWLISIMSQLSYKRTSYENSIRMWDYLYIVTDYKIELDPPDFYERRKEVVPINTKVPINYSRPSVKYRYYGTHMEVLFRKIMRIVDEDRKDRAMVQYMRLMKTFYFIWNNNNLTLDLIHKHIKSISNSKIDILERAKNSQVLQSFLEGRRN